MAAAPGTAATDGFRVGIYADQERTLTCVNGAPGAGFHQHVWAWVPPDTGLAYLTLRFRFPAVLDLTARPALHPQVADLIISEYPPDTTEWNLVLTGCPDDWILVLSQWCVITGDAEGAITILAPHSMARDCRFDLHDLEVLNNLAVNDPACETTDAGAATWSAVKSCYR